MQETMKEQQSAVQEHKLSESYAIWVRIPHEKRWDKFSQDLRKLGEFETVEGFWAQYMHLKRDVAIPSYDLCFFKSRVPPLWEDAMNIDGGMVEISGQGVNFFLIFEILVLSMIGQQILPYGQVNGLYFRHRNTSYNHKSIIQVWFKDFHDHVVKDLRASLSRILLVDISNKIKLKILNTRESLSYAKKTDNQHVKK